MVGSVEVGDVAEDPPFGPRSGEPPPMGRSVSKPVLHLPLAVGAPCQAIHNGAGVLGFSSEAPQ